MRQGIAEYTRSPDCIFRMQVAASTFDSSFVERVHRFGEIVRALMQCGGIASRYPFTQSHPGLSVAPLPATTVCASRVVPTRWRFATSEKDNRCAVLRVPQKPQSSFNGGPTISSP